MNLEENKAIVRRAVDELFNRGNVSVADELYAPAYAEHERNFTRIIRTAFPDLVLRVETMVSEGDMVATH